MPPPITPPTFRLPKLQESGEDAFDKALKLIEVLASQEVASLKSSYDRFVWIVQILAIGGAFLLSLAGACLVFFGIHTLHDLHDQANKAVENAVTDQMPKQVTQEVTKDFQPEAIRKIVEHQIRGEVGEDIQRLVKEQVGVAIANELIRQRQLVKSSVSDELTHHISYDQRRGLIADLLTMEPHAILIHTDLDPDRRQYAYTLQEIFQQSKWTVRVEASPIQISTRGNYLGDLFFDRSVLGNMSAAEELKAALYKAGLKVRLGDSGKPTVRGVPAFLLTIYEGQVPTE